MSDALEVLEPCGNRFLVRCAPPPRVSELISAPEVSRASAPVIAEIVRVGPDAHPDVRIGRSCIISRHAGSTVSLEEEGPQGGNGQAIKCCTYNDVLGWLP